MHNIYYLGLSGERSVPFGLLVLLNLAFPGIRPVYSGTVRVSTVSLR